MNLGYVLWTSSDITIGACTLNWWVPLFPLRYLCERSTGGRPHMKKSTTRCWVLTLQFLVAGGEFDCRWSLLLLHFLEPNWGWHRVENTRQEVDEMLLLLFQLLNCSDLLMQPRIFQSNN